MTEDDQQQDEPTVEHERRACSGDLDIRTLQTAARSIETCRDGELL
jgi:hypothetical protein